MAGVRGHEVLHFGTACTPGEPGLASRFHDAPLEATAGSTTPPRLTLRVFQENLRSRYFEEKHGWQPTGRRGRMTFRRSSGGKPRDHCTRLPAS